jgi:class 3 adenylate cyclase
MTGCVYSRCHKPPCYSLLLISIASQTVPSVTKLSANSQKQTHTPMSTPTTPRTNDEIVFSEDNIGGDAVEVDSLSQTTNTATKHPQQSNQKDANADSFGGQDTSSLVSSQSSKFDMDDTTELDEMLQNGHLRGGLFGLLERLPLFVKLFMMLVLALLGIIAIGAALIAQQSKTVKQARMNRKMASLSADVALLVHLVQKERGTAYRYFDSNGTKWLPDLTDVMTLVDEQLIKFNSRVSGYSDLIHHSNTSSNYYNQFTSTKANLQTIRTNVLEMKLNGLQVFNSYSPLVTSLTYMLKSLAGLAKDSQMMYILTDAMQSKDEFGKVRAVVLAGITAGSLSLARYKQLSFSAYADQQYLNSVVAAGRKSIQKMVATKLTPISTTINSITTPLDIYTNMTNISNSTAWINLTNNKINALQDLILYVASLIEDQASTNLNRGTANIVIIVVIITLLIITAIAAAAIFSKAITGPWRRIIEIQDATVRKFVPRGFLRILKCYRLSEINLGKSVERDLTIMFADIRNFTAMSENMTPQQNFMFLNNYLARVGPVIRKHAGYIDKFMGDGIMACFPNFYSGARAALDVQEVITAMNTETPNNEYHLRVGIGIHTGRTIVGAIGENERMEGTMISDAVNLAARLETLTKAFRAKILTTHEGMKRLRAPSEFAYRPLGYVKVKGKKKHIKVYELLDKVDTDKMESVKEFKQAVDLMNSKIFDESLELLDGIVRKYPGDYGAQRVRDSCAMHNELFKEQVKALQVHQALLDSVLRDAFSNYCKEERSEENFKCWIATEEYRNTPDEVNRIILTKKLYQNYLSPNAKHQVNTSDEVKKQVKTAIINYDETLIYPPAILFNNLQTELEMNLSDPFARFKRKSHLFLDSFRKSLPVPLVHIMDEDVL